jgi:hypothetical protein
MQDARTPSNCATAQDRDLPRAQQRRRDHVSLDAQLVGRGELLDAFELGLDVLNDGRIFDQRVRCRDQDEWLPS